jgi:hypothetical protein
MNDPNSGSGPGPGSGSRIKQYAETSQQLVSQAGDIVLQANDQAKKGTFDSTQWSKSVQKLLDLALAAGLEVVPYLLPSPCFGGSGELELSDFNKAEQPDNQCERVLSVAQSFVLDGAPSYRIPDHLIVFVPAVLRVNAIWFRVGVKGPNLRSGTYRGRVRMTQLKKANARVDEMDVIVDL